MSEQFQNNIKSWVQMDNQIKRMNAEISDLRTRRNNIQDHITEFGLLNKDLMKSLLLF